MKVTFHNECCEALNEALLAHVSGLPDFTRLVDRGEVEKASHVGREYVDDLLLLLDGIDLDDDGRGQIDLGVLVSSPECVFGRIRQDAIDLRDSEQIERAEQEAMWRKTDRVIEVCDEILGLVAA